eukprot:843603_1
MSSDKSQMVEKLLSVAYGEVEGSKPGEKELAFISSVYDFLNRQSTYLSDTKISNKLLKITNKAIEDSSKKNEAVNKKPKKDKKKGKKK